MPRAQRSASSLQRKAALLALGVLAGGCATARLPPPAPAVMSAARAAATYSARLHVSLSGPGLRARTPALLAFQRPDALRVEIPGPSGARLVAVLREGRLLAVFPGDRAFFEGAGGAAELEALLGVSLTPLEVMDLLVGTGSPRLQSYDLQWGPTLPRQVKAVLPDGARLTLRVEEAEAGIALPAQAFVPPHHSGYRALPLEEARRLWARRP